MEAPRFLDPGVFIAWLLPKHVNWPHTLNVFAWHGNNSIPVESVLGPRGRLPVEEAWYDININMHVHLTHIVIIWKFRKSSRSDSHFSGVKLLHTKGTPQIS